MITITSGGSRLYDTGRVPWGEFREARPSPKAVTEGVLGCGPTYFCENCIDSIF